MMTQEEIRKHLEVLKIQDAIANVSLKDVNSAFRKLASEMHPDKAGDASTAAFQELLNSCHILRKYLKEKPQEEEQVWENDDDFKFFEDNFEKFNFPFENKGSFTVVIEDYLADTWQECMENILGEPKVIINAWGTECDRIWKVKHGNSDITLHIYNKPKNKKGSKLMIQGCRQSLICSYVFDELPKMYKMVCNNKPVQMEESARGKKTSFVKCDQCKYKSSMIQMKMHIKSIHSSSRAKVTKRLSNFTPIVKPAKKSKHGKPNKMNLLLNAEGIADESILLLDVDCR